MNTPTMYEGVNLLGADICTGGPGSRAWVSGMYMHDEFEDMELQEMYPLGLHTTQGCEIFDWPIDAPDYLPAGSTRMDWFPRTVVAQREPGVGIWNRT